MNRVLRAVGATTTKGDEQIMTERTYETRYDRAEGDAGRFGRWLSRRPAESWMFFAAGVFLGGLFF